MSRYPGVLYSEDFNDPKIVDLVMNPTPEKLGITPLQYNKIGKKMKKIFKFWENNLPKDFFELILNDYYTCESAVVLGSEFSCGGIYEKKDFTNFPWVDEILKKRKEIFGF